MTDPVTPPSLYSSHPLVRKACGLWLPSDAVNQSSEAEPALFVRDGVLYECCALAPYYNAFRVRHYSSALRPAHNALSSNPRGQIVVDHQNFNDKMVTVHTQDDVDHLFAHTNTGQPGNQIRHYTLASDFAPVLSDVPVVMTAPSGEFVFNCGVAERNGEHFMAVEVSVRYAQILKSTDADLKVWTPVAQFEPPRGYIGAVGLKSGRGGLYLHYCRPLNNPNNGAYGTTAAVSTDGGQTWTEFAGNNWYFPTQILLAPDVPYDKVNATDLDMIDFNGSAAMAYFAGNQLQFNEGGEHSVAAASWPGTVEQFFEEFFPYSP